MIDHNRLSAISSPAWLAGLGIALSFIFGLLAGFDGFAVALGLSILVQGIADWKRAGMWFLFASAFGATLGGIVWARLTWNTFKEILGIGQPPARMYGKSKVVIKEDHSTGYHMRFEEYEVERGYWPIMATRALGGDNINYRGWKRYFGGDVYYNQFVADLVDAGYAEWRNPDHHQSGVVWTDDGLAWWRKIRDGEASIE